jgi:hypothetical protein
MTMKKILRNYPEVVLAALAVVFVAIIAVAFIWGIGDVATAVYRAVNAPPGGGGNVGFNLQAAQQLNLRGLVNPGQ